jgi:hypothetical protein
LADEVQSLLGEFRSLRAAEIPVKPTGTQVGAIREDNQQIPVTIKDSEHIRFDVRPWNSGRN